MPRCTVAESESTMMMQGQIQVGPSHQARLPPMQLDTAVELCESREDLVWMPNTIADVDLLMYLRAARSMAAFVGWCDGGSTDDGCAAASMDETTVSSLQLLHDNSYDTGRALQALVKIINPKSADRRWSDDDAKRFVKGLKQHGKNFFKIRRDLLPAKNTAQLVEYYYLWKKSATASTTRPHRRHRRPAALRRQAPTPTPPSSESVEGASDGSENEMDSDEGSGRATPCDFVCMRCQATESKNWYQRGGKDSGVVCSNCKPLCDSSEPPPFMFRPVKDEEDHVADGDHQSTSSVDGSPQTSDEGTGGRASPCSASSRSSSSSGGSGRLHALPSEKEMPTAADSQLKCPSPLDGIVVRNSGESNETGPSLPGIPALHKIPDNGSAGTVPSSEAAVSSVIKTHCSPDHWKRPPLTDDPGKLNDSKVFTPTYAGPNPSNDLLEAVSCQPSAGLMLDYRTICETAIKREMGLPQSDSTDAGVKSDVMFGGGNLAGGGRLGFAPPGSPQAAPGQWSSDPHNARTVMSVAPCAPLYPGEHSWSRSPPPPLLRTSASSINDMERAMGGRSPRELIQQQQRPEMVGMDGRMMMMMTTGGEQEAVEQSDNEDDADDMSLRRTPSPEPRVINEEFYRKNSTILVRRWYRGRTTCSRCDLEFVPVPGTPLATRLEGARSKQTTKPPAAATKADFRRHDSLKKEDEKKKPRTPTENRSFDAQITSTLMSAYGGDLPPGVPRGPPPFQAIGHGNTPALQKLSDFIRPHAAAAGPPEAARYMPFGPGLPPPPGAPPGMEQFFGMPPPGAFMPGSWEAVEREIAKEKRDRDVWEREMREIEFVEKMRQEIAAQGLDRLIPPPGAQYWEELQRAYGPLGLGAGLPPQVANIPGLFPPPGLNMELMQRERERIEALRLNQEQQQQLAAAMTAAGNRENAAAVYQLFQKYSQDPVMLQRQLLAMSSPKDQELARMMDASSLIYHFARADPLAGSSSGGGPTPQSMQQGMPPNQAPPPPPPSHFQPMQEHPLVALAQNYERMYMELMSRPPYNSDPALQQQLMMQLSAQHDSLRHQFAAMERDSIASQQQQQQQQQNPSLR